MVDETKNNAAMNDWKIIDFFRVGTAESFGRLASFILILTGCILAAIEVAFSLYQFAWCNQAIYPIHTALILELVLIGKAGKVASKYFEKQTPPPEI